VYDWLSGPAATFLAVFLGAAVGAWLTVRWTNHSYDRQAAAAAFTRLHRLLYSLLESGAQHHEWRRVVVDVTGDLGLVKWHAKGWRRKRRRDVREAVRLLAAELETQIDMYSYVRNWGPMLERVAALKRALYGTELDELSDRA